MDFRWLVEGRSKIQLRCLELYEFKKSLDRTTREHLWPVTGVLVGASFSLWRAVFLAPPEISPDAMYEHAQKLLGILIETNAVGFAQDVSSRHWMARYYLNNTVFRLRMLVDDPCARKIIGPVASPEELNFFEKFRPDQQDRLRELSCMQLWDEAIKGYEIGFGWLKGAYPIATFTV